MRFNRILITALAMAAIHVIPRPAMAQWTHGSYSVNQVLTNIGNHTYSAGANSGTVDATKDSSGSSSIRVEFKAEFSANSGDPSLNLVGHGTLTGGGSGSNYSGTAAVEGMTGGVISRSFQSPNSLNSSETLGGETAQLAPGPITAYVIASASAGVMGSGNTCWADSVVWYAF